MSNYYIGTPTEGIVLCHHGVKGMKWGIRKSINRSLDSAAYRTASRYVQKRDLKNLKKKKRSSGMTGKQYRQERRQIKANATADRGRRLIANNQTYGKVLMKSAAKTGAAMLGSHALAVYADTVGFHQGATMARAYGLAMIGGNAVNTGRQLREIHAARKKKK